MQNVLEIMALIAAPSQGSLFTRPLGTSTWTLIPGPRKLERRTPLQVHRTLIPERDILTLQVATDYNPTGVWLHMTRHSVKIPGITARLIGIDQVAMIKVTTTCRHLQHCGSRSMTEAVNVYERETKAEDETQTVEENGVGVRIGTMIAAGHHP